MIPKKKTFLLGFFVLVLLLGLAFLMKPAQAAAVSGPAGFGEGLEQASWDGAQSTLACTPDVPGMAAYWPADSIAGSQLVDAAGSHTGSCAGANCPVETPGKVAGALDFAGGKRLNVPYSADFDWGNTDSFSVELWVKTESDCSALRQVYVGKYHSSASFQSWWVGCEVTNQAAFNMRDSTSQSLTINGGPAINDGNWHHVVAVRDAAETRNLLYVDGALATAQIQAYAGDFIDVRELNFGYYNVAPFYPYGGALDEVSIYNRALTLEEVQRHYNGGAGKAYCNQPPDAVDDGPFVAIRNTPLVIESAALLANDLDPEGDPILITAVDPTTTQSGTVTGSGPYTYNPPADYSGSDSFTYTVSDQISGTDTATVTVTVRLTNAPPILIAPPDRTDPEGAAVSLQLQASDPDGDPLSFKATNLPEGLSLDPLTGVISGTLSFSASSGSPYNVGVTATDAGFLGDTETFAWTVTDINGAPLMQQPSNQFNNEGDTISVQIEASDPDNDKLAYAITGLPAGLSYNPDTGLINGSLSYTSSPGSPYLVSVVVSDPFSHSDQKTFQWIVADASPPDIFLPLVLKLVNEE
jgi:hypothetical protein